MGNPGFTTGPVAPASPAGAPHTPAPDDIIPISAPATPHTPAPDDIIPISAPATPHTPAPDDIIPISAPNSSPSLRPVAAPTPSPSPGPAPSAATTRLDSPHELGASAGIARQIATDLDNANGKGGNNLAEHASTAATKIRGFSFGGALTASTDRWLQQCRSLHDKLTGAAENLEATQRNYRSNEHATTAQFGA
ncbi:hypothetical protein [Kitasatospora sp. NPDC047058]|uniref:hypothetical protein n=1 Tax=Kitasatospora sp. NPDC047058 TaxID=3155620 RepID=UPI00340C9609